MFSFCKKTLQTFQTSSHSKSESSRPCRNVPSPTYGLSLIVAADCRKPANVLDSAAVKPPPPLTNSVKKDPSGLLGCLEDFSGVGPFDGLSSCTESLGFESCDQMEEMIMMDEISRSRSTDRSSLQRRSRERSRTKRREDLKKLPPPLSSLNRNGQSSFFLKPLRKDGRLQLVEVRIDRPEIFQVSRQDGRLRLQLIESESESESESEPELQEEERVEVWKIPVTSGRCQELRNHYNHHNLPLWNHQCVT